MVIPEMLELAAISKLSNDKAVQKALKKMVVNALAEEPTTGVTWGDDLRGMVMEAFK